MQTATVVLVVGSSTTRFRRGRHVAVLIFAATALIGSAKPCLACSCVKFTDEESFAEAEVVFTGEAVDRRDPSAGSTSGSTADPIFWTFDVSSTQKGHAGERQEISTSRDGASCGFAFALGRRYQVFAYPFGGELRTGLCTGTRALEPGTAAYVPPGAPAPPPEAPSPSRSEPLLVPTRTPAATAQPSPETDLATGAGVEGSSIPALVAALSALAALGIAASSFLRGSRKP